MRTARSQGARALYPTVAVLVEDLRRQRVALLGTLVFRDVTVHPKPLLLPHGDVHLQEVDSIGLQESHHCLLMLLHLEMERGKMVSKWYRAFLGGNLSGSILTDNNKSMISGGPGAPNVNDEPHHDSTHTQM